jgi:Cu2+-exporting ATPase
VQAAVMDSSVGTSGHSALNLAQVVDDPKEWDVFSRQLPGKPGWREAHLVIEGMRCGACAVTVEDALKSLPGVSSVSVSAGSRRARLIWSEQQSRPSEWLQAVEKSGYRAVPAQDVMASERRQRESRKVFWRLLVAGFCMMQVMMYAWPAYVAEPGDLSAEMEQLLRWASWVLTLPVMFFSCGPFFSNAWRDVAQRKISMDLPVALGIAITFAVSSMGTFEPQGAFGKQVYFDSLTMFVFFLLMGRWLEQRLYGRTSGALESLMNRLPDSVQRQQSDGQFQRVAIRHLHAGDVVRILPGESFPADGVILEGQTQVNEALLTGESRPLGRTIGSFVIAGSHNLSGLVLMRVERVAEQTRFAQIVRLMESAAATKPQMAQLADRLAKPFLLGVLLSALAAAVYGWTLDPAHALMVAVSVLVVTCPCALSLATPVATLAAAGQLARRGVLVSRLQALEALAEIDLIVFDKTGTLTHDAMRVEKIILRPGVSELQVLTLATALAQHSLHPVSRALIVAATERGICPIPAQSIHEVAGQGVRGEIRDEQGGLRRLALGTFQFCAVESPLPEAPHACLSDEQGWLATFELMEAVRSDAASTIASLQQMGLEVQIWSGDSPAAVQQVACRVDVTEAYGNCTPQDKLRKLRAAQQSGKKVAMVGDGLNDGPSLAAANVAFVMGQSVPLAQSKADFLVMGEQLERVVDTVFRSRMTVAIVRQNLLWAAVYNAICVPLAVLGWMPAWLAGLGMACSSLGVVLNALRLSSDTGLKAKGIA